MVWVIGFEPTTSQSRTARATSCATPRYIEIFYHIFEEMGKTGVGDLRRLGWGAWYTGVMTDVEMKASRDAVLALQKRAYQNKLDHNFNVKDVNLEFCLLYGEVAEAYEAWNENHDDLDEELADVAIYLLGLAEILGIDLGDAILKKMQKNEKRVYPKRKSTVHDAAVE